ncbi:MAG: hypothetical protein HYY01_08670 [Chloroflexi bacterium]|nr:hypothetical protein [Chloroflexota bacterium]
MCAWVYNPQVGGKKVPPVVRLRTEQRIRTYADAHYGGKFSQLDIRFRGALCYIDAHLDPTPTGPLHLCRLRYFGNEEAWSMAFYTYSHERYEPSIFPNGTFYGTPEEAFEMAAVYL